MDDFGRVMEDLHSWLSAEFGREGVFLLDKETKILAAIPRISGSPFTLTRTEDGILVGLGLGVTLMIPRDDPFSMADIQAPLRSIITSGILLSVPIEPFGEPVIRYTIDYEYGALSSKVPGREYVEFPTQAWQSDGSAV